MSQEQDSQMNEEVMLQLTLFFFNGFFPIA